MKTVTKGFISVLLLLTGLTSQAADQHWKHVLVLHSYHRGFTFTEAQTDGINAVLSPESAWIEQHVVHMDSHRDDRVP